ncbi:MAG: alpha/beta hydrolase [Burkholderiales bacterium PBB5]|nr:MAG: alpha/beta hydrolase [Burkholderiales bacterium PBB5]
MKALLVRLVGVLLLLTGLAIPLVRAPDRAVETLVARWAPPPSSFLDLQGQLVHLRDEGPRGDPAPIVLIHGTSASLHTWEGWAKALRGQRRVISLDLPGFGLTGPWAGSWAGRDYTGAEYARFVLATLDRLGVQRFVIGGNSLGGEVAWRVAAAAPQRVSQLLLVDASGYRRSAGEIPLGWQLARLPVLGRLTEQLLPRPLITQGLVTVMGDPSRITDAMIDRYFELTLREGNRAALLQRARHWTAGEGVDHVTGVSAPTLILWGGRDRVLPPDLAQRFADDIAGSQLQRFDTLGHIPQEEDPVATVAVVRRFLGLGAPGSGPVP